jgi:hypothetical protein
VNGKPGINRAIWDLHYANNGPFVHLGTYEVRVAATGTTVTGRLEVREDPRIRVAPAVRRAHTETLLWLEQVQGQLKAPAGKARPVKAVRQKK